MPRYDYRCTGCGHEFELVQSFHEAGAGTCPLCSGAGQRVFHAVPVIYKGSGFYTTDYGRPKRQAESSNKEGTDGDQSSTKDASSDTNKDASSDTKGKESTAVGSSGSADSNTESSSKASSETSS